MPALYFSSSYNNSFSGANLTPYSGVIFWGVILGLQPRDMAALLGVKQKNISSKNLHENRV